MTGHRVLAAAAAIGVAFALAAPRAAQTVDSQTVEVELQLGDTLFGEGRYIEALDAYKNAVRVAPPEHMHRARAGLITAALRVAEFDLARQQAEQLVKESPRTPD